MSAQPDAPEPELLRGNPAATTDEAGRAGGRGVPAVAAACFAGNGDVGVAFSGPPSQLEPVGRNGLW